LNESLVEKAFESVKKLVEDFRAHERDYLSPNYQESHVRQDFIDKFFIALGWDVTHERQKNPHESEVQIENRVVSGNTQQRAEYAFFLAPNFRDPKFFVEAKKPPRQLKNADFFYQTMRYGWNGNTPIAILTDFEELYVIDCRLKPNIKDALDREIKSFRYADYADEEKFKWIYWLFSHEAVAGGSIEKFAKPEAWKALAVDTLTELSHQVAGLPTELDPENEEAKRFDLLALNLQLALLREEPGFERLRDRVKEIAGLLEDKASIPMVREQMVLIQDIQTDEWWEDVTVPMLELMRRRLRGLVQFIEKRLRKPVYTDFEDTMGVEVNFEQLGLGVGTDMAKFRAKARAFLREHLNDIAIEKLRRNKPLTTTDLAELERILAESGTGGPDEIRTAAQESKGLGLFVRSLVGMEREAAKEAMAGFIKGKMLSANQLEFINLIVDHLTEYGYMEPFRLYESPFTDLTPRGPDGLFKSTEMDELLRVLDTVRLMALAA